MSICAVAGMGGVGKTELATQYARTHEADYPGGICWLNARDTNLPAEIIQFAQLYLNLEVPQELGGRRLNLEEQVAWCWQRWQPPEGQVLVVLDDVTNLGNCRKVLPRASRFRVLMTTQLRRIDTNFVELPLDVLSPEAALELLAALVGEKRVGLTSPPAPLLQGEGSKKIAVSPSSASPSSLSPPFPRREGGLGGLGLSDAVGTSPPAPLLRGEGSKKIAVSPSSTSPSSLSPPFPRREGGQGGLGSSDALRLCEWLGYLPLGLELVGQYLADDPDLSLAEMLERLKAQQLEDEAINPSEEQLQETEMTAKRGVRAAFELSWQELDSVTQRVAQYLSLFAPTVFLWEWVESDTELLNCSESDINAAKKQLYKRHLIQRVEEREGGYKIHPLIREFLQAKLAVSQQADEFRQAFTTLMAVIVQQLSEYSTLEDIESVKDAIPHLEEVAQNFRDATSDKDLLSIFVGLGRFYAVQGLYSLAAHWSEQCLSAMLVRFGNNHPNVATSLFNQAECYRSQGRYSEAEPLYLQALQLWQCLAEGDHPAVAQIMNGLALLYEYQGRYNEAEPLYLQVLEQRKRLLGDNQSLVAQSLDHLAGIYECQGRYSEAEPLYLQALALRKRLLGDEHLVVAITLNNLANLYDSQGRYSEAEPLYLQALEQNQRLLGDDHPTVAKTINNLASLYYAQRRYSEAEPLYLQALEQRQRLLGNDHLDVAQSINNLATLYLSQGRYSEAEPLYLQALEQRKHLLGNDHPAVATTLNNLAGLYFAQRRYNEANLLFLQAFEFSKRVLGINHPNTVSIGNCLTLCRAVINATSSTRTAKSKQVGAIKTNQSFKQATGFGSEHTLNLTDPLKKAKGKRKRKRRD